MKKNKAKKAIVTIFASLLLCSIFAVPAFAKTEYPSTLHFNSTLNGAKHYYDGSTVGLRMTLYTGGTNAYAHVGLWRHYNMFNSDLVGTADYYEGYSNKYWTNAGSGEYNFYFEKYGGGTDAASHYAWLTSNDLVMYSY